MGAGDHLIHHYLALVYACNRRLPEAIANIKQALNLRSDHVPSLHLLWYPNLKITPSQLKTELSIFLQSSAVGPKAVPGCDEPGGAVPGGVA